MKVTVVGGVTDLDKRGRQVAFTKTKFDGGAVMHIIELGLSFSGRECEAALSLPVSSYEKNAF